MRNELWEPFKWIKSTLRAVKSPLHFHYNFVRTWATKDDDVVEKVRYQMIQELLGSIGILNRIIGYIPFQPELLNKLCLINKAFYCAATSDLYWRRIWFKKYPGSAGIINKKYRCSYILMRQYWKSKCEPIYKSKKRLNNPYHLEDRDHARIGLFGEEGVGKTALITRYTQSVFLEDFDPTSMALTHNH